MAGYGRPPTGELPGLPFLISGRLKRLAIAVDPSSPRVRGFVALTAKKTAKPVDLCGRPRMIMDWRCKSPNLGGRLRTPADVRPAVFKTVCGPLEIRAPSRARLLNMWRRSQLAVLLSVTACNRAHFERRRSPKACRPIERRATGGGCQPPRSMQRGNRPLHARTASDIC